jgi:dipeptidyl aminopeptidase/acylaminoacyl peptidase
MAKKQLPIETNQSKKYKDSPLFAAEHARAPIFVAHGEGYPPYASDSPRFVAAMRRFYKNVEHIVYSGESYEVLSPDGLRQLWVDVCDFLDHHLK